MTKKYPIQIWRFKNMITLIIATGSTTNFFKFPKEVSDKMMQMKDIPQGIKLTQFYIENFEEALLT